MTIIIHNTHNSISLLMIVLQGRKMIPHVKMLPECRNVTKQNCVTLWETDPEGENEMKYF